MIDLDSIDEEYKRAFIEDISAEQQIQIDKDVEENYTRVIKLLKTEEIEDWINRLDANGLDSAIVYRILSAELASRK